MILPGVQSDFPIDVRQILPAGHYTVTASMDFGSRRGQAISRDFTLIGPNELPSPNLAVNNFNAMGTIGDPAHLSAQVASTGSAPVSVTLEANIYHLYDGVADNRPVACRHRRLAALERVCSLAAVGDDRSLGDVAFDRHVAASVQAGRHRHEDAPGAHHLVDRIAATGGRHERGHGYRQRVRFLLRGKRNADGRLIEVRRAAIAVEQDFGLRARHASALLTVGLHGPMTVTQLAKP